MLNQCRVRSRSFFAASRARTTSHRASWASSETQAGVTSPAIYQRASFSASAATRPDPVPAFTRTRGDATGIHTEVCALPVAHVPGRTGFVAGPKPLRRTQLACHFANRFESIRIIPTDRTSPPVQLRQSSQQGHRVPQTVVWSLRPIPVVRALRRTSQSQRNLRTATQLVGRCLIFAYWCTTVSQVEPCVLCYPSDSITSRGFQKE